MILDRAINGPRASMETRTLSQEELGRFLKNLFLTGEDVEPGQRAAERLSRWRPPTASSATPSG